MEYSEKVYRLTGLLLEAEENCESIELILDADLAYDVAVTLQDELGKDFFYESDEDDFDYLLKNHDILGITVARYDCEITYFLEEVNYNGITLESEMDSYYIQDCLLDCLDLDRLHGDKYLIKEFECSEEAEFESEDYTVENELDGIFEEIVEDTLEDIEEFQDNEEFCLHCTIKEAVQRGYIEGYRKAQEMLRDALDENLDNMDY